MKKPSTQTMVLGHPAIAATMTLLAGISLLAGFYAGNALLVLFAIAIIARVHAASEQADAYRAWNNDWDAMGENPPRPGGTLRHVVGVCGRVVVIAALMLTTFAARYRLAHMAGYMVGWTSRQPWLLAMLGLVAVVVLVRFIRHRRRRTTRTKLVTVVAKPILPVPTLAKAYAALPDYCHALLRGQA